jgi:hypothetical protein
MNCYVVDFEFMIVIEFVVVQIIEFVEDKRKFSTLTFIKTKLQNQFYEYIWI